MQIPRQQLRPTEQEFSTEWTWESSFCILIHSLGVSSAHWNLDFENWNHCLWLLSENRIVNKLFDAYIFPNRVTRQLKICNIVLHIITVMSLEIEFRILFMTKKKKKLGGGDNFHIWLNISGKICDYLCVLMSNIYLISLRDGITGPLTKLRWFQDGLATPPEYILNFCENHCPKNSADKDENIYFTPKKGTKLRLLKQKSKGHIHTAELYTVTPSDLLF